MTTRLEKMPAETPVPLCLMLSDDEDRNIRMMFEHPPRLTARRTHAPQRRLAFASVGGVFVGVFAAALVAVRKGLI